MIFQYGSEPVLIQRILINFEAIQMCFSFLKKCFYFERVVGGLVGNLLYVVKYFHLQVSKHKQTVFVNFMDLDFPLYNYRVT